MIIMSTNAKHDPLADPYSLFARVEREMTIKILRTVYEKFSDRITQHELADAFNVHEASLSRAGNKKVKLT